jgi:glycosyltransferase involved in cell wall biosynthesis
MSFASYPVPQPSAQGKEGVYDGLLPLNTQALSERVERERDSDVRSVSAAAKGIAFAFVGLVAPDEPRFHNVAFSRPGCMAQVNMLVGLKHAGLSASAIISPCPIQAFPRSRRLFVRGSEETLSEGLRVSLLPFLNITLLKEICIGIGTALNLIRWGWRSRNKNRVVFTYNLSVPPGIFTLFAARLIGAKSMACIYDVNVPGETVSNNFWHRIDYRLQRWLIPRYDSHVVITDSIMRDFAPQRQYLRLEGGVTTETLERMGCVLERDDIQDKFTIVTAATLSEYNGIPEILQAFSLLHDVSYRLVIAGDGPLRKTVEDAAARDSRIQYLGYLQFEEVLELYKKASVLICMRMTKKLNTKYFFPSKIMEYLASGVPVVSTCTNHIEEEFKGLLYFLKDETPEGLASLIPQIANSDPKERRELARKARAFMAAKKTWDAQGRRLADFIITQAMGS